MEMPGDPENQSAFHQDEPKVETREEDVDEGTGPGRPTCPQCGWHNTRLSHTTGMLDSFLRRFSLRAFRCRSCGKRFRTFRRTPQV